MVNFLLAAASLVQVVDALSGRPIPQIHAVVARDDRDASRVVVEAHGSVEHYADFHGTFSAAAVPPQIRLLPLTSDEEHELSRVNAFRAQFGAQVLHADENLMESARYWAREERIAGRVGHTCASLGQPSGCIEFNAYFHRLPGAPADWFAGQNAAFDTFSSWRAPESGFEHERYAVHGERGHFLNLVEAAEWVGFGETVVPGYGAYFAMNLL